MTPLAPLRRGLAIGLLTLLVAPTAWSQLVIGQTSGFTGPVASGVKENTDGAKLWIDHINASGGVKASVSSSSHSTTSSIRRSRPRTPGS